MKLVYLVAAIIGAIVPYVYFIDHFQLHGMGLGAFIAEATITPAAQGVTADASIASFVFWAFMVQRYPSGSGPNPILFVVLNLAIGLSCALPAYLFEVERRRDARPAARA
jgi:hypothetical protein